MNKVFLPPHNYDEGGLLDNDMSLFLAGTIDNGNSENWQQRLINELNDVVHPIKIYNPRREEWPSSDDTSEIEKQIKWELYHLEKADLIVMNVLGNSKSPISLMEIGLFARSGKLIVFCDPSFYRFDNVRIVCETYGVSLFKTNDIAVIKDEVLKRVND